MDQWALLTVGALAVAAAWDFGRRVTQKTANELLTGRIDAISRLLDVHVTNHADCLERVEDLEAKLRGLASKQEAQAAAANRPRGGFPRIG